MKDSDWSLNKIGLKLIILLGLFWIVSISLAVWFGLGWFFLMVTVRRIAIAIPTSRAWLNKMTGIKSIVAENKNTNVALHQILQAITILGWVGLTILVFLKANIRLLDIIR